MLRALLWLFLIGVVALGGGAYFVQHEVTAAGPAGTAVTVDIPKGSGLVTIAALLKDADVIESDWLLFVAAVMPGPDKRPLKAGEYEFPAHASPMDVVALLRSGKVVAHKLTIPEGLTVAQVLDLVKAEPALSGDIGDAPPEGRLMPDTYHFTKGEARSEVIARMRTAMTEALAAAWKDHAAGLPYDSAEEALILASIVEKETGVPGERGHIAGVFVNRLRKGMKLQSDPTVIYGLTKGQGALGRPLTKADLEDDDPYNTYVHAGLPPSPIANPGREAIKAAMLPQDTDDLYFVADGSGGHAFAATLDAHNRNVRKWREVKREGAAPVPAARP